MAGFYEEEIKIRVLTFIYVLRTDEIQKMINIRKRRRLSVTFFASLTIARQICSKRKLGTVLAFSGEF